MTTKDAQALRQPSKIVHRLAVVLTIAVFPLIWVGGLVTTYDAGMAVPDWPGTYGWNMFAYPASTWLFGPFDLLVEHSHRLLGAVAGFLSIGLVVSAYWWDHRPWFKLWCVGILLAVIAQGVLGGVRVLLDQRTFAMVHGCTGPLFFALATATAVMSSQWWAAWPVSKNASQLPAASESGCSSRFVWTATALLMLSYFQLVMGAQLRHVTATTEPAAFMGFVHTHLLLAFLVLLAALGVASVVGVSRRLPGGVRRPGLIILGVVFLQIALGIGTWIVNYALPWQELSPDLARYVIQAKGYWESLIVTAHVATGSLIISLATVLTLRAWRCRVPKLVSSTR